MAERKGDTKSTLLDELESIKGLLDEDQLDDIPVLREVIESIEWVDPDRPRQPSLFTRDHDSEPLAPNQRQRRPQPTRAEGENPFLPAHIRARLQGNQPPALLSESELGAGGQSWSRFSQPDVRQSDPNLSEPQPVYESQAQVLTRSELIKAVIAELRPDIETRLRARLEPLSQDMLLELLTAGDDDETQTENEN